MYMRAVTFRIVYVGVLSLGILMGAAFRESTVLAAAAAAPASDPAPRSLAVAAAPVVTLPVISVRHAAIEAHAAKRPPVEGATAPADAGGESLQAESRGSAALPTLRLDMPYYSFGKLLPRVGKE